MRLHCSNLRQDLKNLMIGDQAGEFIDQEVDRLYEVIEETAGPMATDGGYLSDDIFGNLPQLGWQKLTRLFLRTRIFKISVTYNYNKCIEAFCFIGFAGLKFDSINRRR